MSVDRGTLARIVGVPEYMVKCKKCHYYDPVKVGHRYADFCTFWHLSCKAEEFCSFYISKKDSEELAEGGLRPADSFGELLKEE